MELFLSIVIGALAYLLYRVKGDKKEIEAGFNALLQRYNEADRIIDEYRRKLDSASRPSVSSHQVVELIVAVGGLAGNLWAVPVGCGAWPRDEDPLTKYTRRQGLLLSNGHYLLIDNIGATVPPYQGN